MAQVYRGAIGRTRTATVHVADHGGALVAVQVYTTVDASDPQLVERLLGDALNVVQLDGTPVRIAVPVVYHDPEAGLLVLVLGDAHRHRELEERAAVLEQLRGDPAAIPPYAKDFSVVFGAAGLRAHLAQRAQQRTIAAELERKTREVEELAGALEAARAELAQLRGDPRAGDTESFDVATDIETELAAEADIEVEIDAAPSTDLLTTELAELPVELAHDAGGWSPPYYTDCFSDGGGVRAIAVASEQVARGFTGALDVRLVLHRTPLYPVIALVMGAPDALRSPAITELVVLTLDVANPRDRGALEDLGREFEIALELATRDRRFRRCRVRAPLAANVAYVVRAADEHLRTVAASDEPSYAAACLLVRDPGFDLLGTEHPERHEFRDDKLAQIATAQQLRRALAMARRFTGPAREDYLVCTRGYPLARWHQLRREILARAVDWGLWMGGELAQIAVSEGLARSRRELVGKLDRGFESLRHDRVAFDIDADAAADNAAAIAGEARALGVELRPVRPNEAGVIASETAAVVSGSIGAIPPRVPGAWSTEDLLAQLEEGGGPREGRLPRVVAALALCHRADPQTAAAVIAAAMKMSRGEAVRVLAMAVKFGAAAKPGLLEGLTSSKAFLRHGCALALALLRADDATRAVIDLLVSEPTELWREIARAVGQIGPPALDALARSSEQLRDRPASQARIVWAMAHVGVRGGKPALAAMAEDGSIAAPLAAKAVTLLALAASDQVGERRGATAARPERDLTVNQAFSRQFFEALEQDRADAVSAAFDASAVVEP